MAAYEACLNFIYNKGKKKKCPRWTNGATNTIWDRCLSVETELPHHTEAGGALGTGSLWMHVADFTLLKSAF